MAKEENSLATAVASVVLILVCGVAVIGLSYSVGRSEGNLRGYTEGRDHCEQEHECHSSETRPCAFGAGIVGIQICGWGDKWGKCRPDPDCCRSPH